MNKPEGKVMEGFVDKLCDHLPMERVKMLIDNGFDQWETITFLNGDQLIDLGFDTQQCIVIMVAANSNALQKQQSQIFGQQKMQEVIRKAQQNDKNREQQILNQQRQLKERQKEGQEKVGSEEGSMKQVKSMKQYPRKEISEGMLVKGTFMKTKPGEKVNLSKAHMLSLQQKQITDITNLDKCPNIVNLNLASNYIYRIECLHHTPKLKVLKLEHNNLTKIQNLDFLPTLQHLYLSNNYISRLQNLTRNPNLQELYISKQKIKTNFTFDPETTSALSYTLQKLECKQNNVRNITELKFLNVVKEVYLDRNLLDDVAELSETINGMASLKIISFKDNPLTKSQKYRDYIVILSKTLEQLDGKKILAKQREYLVKLYALKHAKQQKEQVTKVRSSKQVKIDLKGVRMQQQYSGQANINRATDLRGNIPHSNTKHTNKR